MSSQPAAPVDHRRRFLTDVLSGLTRPRKELPCKYFYDAEGSRLFDAICEQPEYYPTRTELRIMREHAGEMAEAVGRRCLLIEFGSGSSVKTRLLLDRLGDPAGYVPVDVSCEHLHKSARALRHDYPGLDVSPVCGDFTGQLHMPDAGDRARRVVYFPGSTIGNFCPREAELLLGRIARLAGTDGGLLLGVDLRKDVAVLERAYDDAAGVTAAFNLNLLARINRELGADFDLAAFRHRAVYNETEHCIEMHLVSERAQSVTLAGRRIDFAEGESLLTERSHKYDVAELALRAANCGLRFERSWADREGFFSVLYFRVI